MKRRKGRKMFLPGGDSGGGWIGPSIASQSKYYGLS